MRERTVGCRGVKDTIRKPTALTNMDSLGFMEIEPTIKEPVGDSPRPSACMLQLCNLVLLWDLQLCEQGVSLTLLLAFGTVVLILGCLA